MLKSKTITLALFGIVLLVFITYFTAYAMVFDGDKAIPNLLNKVIENAKQENWDEAEKAANQLKKEWEKKKYLVMLNYAEEEYSTLENSIYRITGATQIKDASVTVTEAEAIKEIWRNIKKLVPEP